MRLKNNGNTCELRAENPIESDAILNASMSDYSPRSAGLMPDDSRAIVLGKGEAFKFADGFVRDARFAQADKWAVTTLLRDWESGKITDEAIASS